MKENHLMKEAKIIPSTLEAEVYNLYNEQGYNDQIFEIISGAVNARPEIIPLPVSHQLTVINDISNKYTPKRKPKNKWLKRKFRGWHYRMSNKDIMSSGTRYGQGEEINPEDLQKFLRVHLPPGTIRRETTSNIYLLCPFHEEKVASLCIGKARWGHVKCFGCGKAMLLSTFLSKTLWHTRKYWHNQLVWHTAYIDPNQLEIPFPETPEKPLS